MKSRTKKSKKPEEIFTEPVKCRRSISLEDKYQVVKYWVELKKQLHDANLAQCAPKNVANKVVGKGGDKSVATTGKKGKAKRAIRKNLQAECAKKFPDIVRQVKVCRWHERAVLERWDELPESLRIHYKTPPNIWLNRLGLPKRGRSQGGGVPLQIQQELDRLLVEMSLGASEVSERKEPCSAEQVAARLDYFEDIQKTNQMGVKTLQTFGVSLLMSNLVSIGSSFRIHPFCCIHLVLC